MNRDAAEEYTEALGQIGGGFWRQILWAEDQGIPAALELSTKDWVEQRLGGYVRLAVLERREAAAELHANGKTQRQIADVLGVDAATINRDLQKGVASATPEESEQEESDASVADATPDLSEAETALEQAAAIAEVLETVKTERRAKRPTPGVTAHPVAAFLWGRLGEIRELDATDAAEEQRRDVIEALDKWAEQLGRLREEISP